MAQTLNVPVRGLHTSPNEHGEIPKGSLVRAENVVFDADGVLAPRRGQAPAIASGADKLHAFSDRVLLHSGSTLSYTDAAVTTKTDYAAPVSAPSGRKSRLARQNGNAYLTSSDGVKRIESVTGSIFAAGVPMGLDVAGSLSGASGFLSNDSAVAYRALWGYRDANDNLMLGAPTGRAIVVMPAVLTAPVNATFTPGAGTLGSATYYYRVSAVNSIGETLASPETSLAVTGPAGVNVNWGAVTGATGYKVYGRTTGAELLMATVGAVTTWLDDGSVTPSGALPGTNTTIATRDVAVTTSIPDGITSSHFLQLYRSSPSVTAGTDPGDELGLVYEGPPPSVANVSQLSRTTNVVTATTDAAHGYATGQIVRVSPGGSAAVSVSVSLGLAAAASRSSDSGATWSTAGISGLSGDILGVCYGDKWVAVGTAGVFTSADALTWSLQAASPTTLRAVAWNGSLYVGVGGTGSTSWVCYTSPTGATWTSRSTPANSNAGRAVGWFGSQWVAVGLAVNVGAGGYGCATSTDGITWTRRLVPSGATSHTYYAVAQRSGTLFALGTTSAKSTDGGVTWTAAGAPAGTYRAAVMGATTLCAVGDANLCATYDGSSWTTRSIGTGQWKGVTWNGTYFVAVGDTAVAAISPTGTTWTPTTITVSGLAAGSGGAVASFSSGDKTITGTPLTTTFTYAETGVDGTLTPAANTATPLTAAVLDQIPSTFAGATLYTSPSQQGILASHYEPPACNDIASYRGSVFWFGTTDRATLDFWLLAGGAPSGVQTNDTITVNGIAYTAKTAENSTAREFRWYQASDYSPASPSLAVRDTAASLIRVLNRAPSSTVYARDTSSANEQPGHIELVSRIRPDSLTVSVSRTSSWAFTSGLTKAPEYAPNRIAWSPTNIPDAYQPTAWADIGEKQKAGIAICATRDSLFALKEDGVWRLTGDAFSFANGPAITPFDTTTYVVGSETPAVLDNVVFALSTKGVVQISDTGTTIISGPIQDQIDPLLTGAMLATTKAVAHGVAYEAEGRYILWVPQHVGETQASKALVYDHFQSLATGEPVWTVRTDEAATALVNPYSGKLCVATSSALMAERKALDYTDAADGTVAVTIDSTQVGNIVVLVSTAGVTAGDALVLSQARGIVLSVGSGFVVLDREWTGGTGAATVYKAIATETEFAPIIPATGGWCHFQETALLFRELSGAYFSETFSTELVPAETAVPFYGTRDYALNEASAAPLNLRTWVTRQHQRAGRLRVRFSHTQALCPWRLEGMSLIFKPVSARLRR